MASIFDTIAAYKTEVSNASAKTEAELEQFRMRFISRKSVVNELFEQFKSIPNDQKKAFGAALNDLKDAVQTTFQQLIDQLQDNSSTKHTKSSDFTLPPTPNATGSRHPVNQVREEIVSIFQRMGFSIADGPEIETDWYNFSALNFPENHPARDMQDTFFLSDQQLLLRTHTSNVQIRLLENQNLPIRAIMPGRVYRNETITARSHCYFHQIEGIYVNENVSFKDLKQTLYHFAKEFFGEKTKVRFRPSYFPFTEPSAEMDISCFICNGPGCRLCKYSGWVEILGSGMIDPQVLINCGIDAEKYTGFAFGMGIERIAMLKYGIDDIRLMSENDVRFLRQFNA